MVDPYQTALIGNCQTCALVDREANIVWACMPNFDSPSVFARILDENGGHFGIEVTDAEPVEQRYLPLTNVLVTRFAGADTELEVVDWMPRYGDGGHWVHPPVIHRLLRPVRGQPRVRVKLNPRPDYAVSEEVRAAHLGNSILFDAGDDRFYLQTNLPLSSVLRGKSSFLSRPAVLSFSYAEPLAAYSRASVEHDLERTVQYWESWSRHTRLPHEYQDAVLRSALALKLLTYEDTGAVIAAATTSLPEDKGGVRNWDYRFCWLRDSYFTVRALSRLSHFEEQDRYVGFLEQLGLRDARLQPVYGIDGRAELVEETLDHLAGAFGSKPVRVGNQAYEHQQNDVFGELMLTITPVFFDIRYENRVGLDELFGLVEHLAEEVMRIWRTEDAGIWEYRDQPAHYVFSKLMCWVALDRAAQIADVRDEVEKRDRWMAEAKVIRDEILEKGWDEEVGAYTGAYGIQHLDAANLLMGHTGFIDPMDERFLKTVEAIERELVVDGLCFRYKARDDFGDPEASFSICTFWYIDALRLTGQREKAREVLEKMLARANHVGLFSEGIHVKTGAFTGNFPQAYTHVAIINSAVQLSRGWGDVGSRHYGKRRRGGGRS